MLGRSAIKLVPVVLVLVLSNDPGVPRDTSTETYQDTRRLLYAMENRRINSDRLAALFNIGDKRIADLIQALDDSDHDISLRAQIVIRYLGNAQGMKAITEWYSRRKNGYWIAGPVPLPLSEWDYNIITMNLVNKPPQKWGEQAVQYIYALAVDSSRRAKTVLDKIIGSAGDLDETTFICHAIKRVQVGQPRKLLTGEKDLAKLVLDNAFFIAPEDRKYSSAQLLGLNDARDKALVEVYINRGRLAEEWYHIVISKNDPGWKFFSIDPVAVS